jgi:hypothetical protein
MLRGLWKENDAQRQLRLDWYDFTSCELFLERNYRISRWLPADQYPLTKRTAVRKYKYAMDNIKMFRLKTGQTKLIFSMATKTAENSKTFLYEICTICGCRKWKMDRKRLWWLKTFMKAVCIASVSTNKCSCSADITTLCVFWSSAPVRTPTS